MNFRKSISVILALVMVMSMVVAIVPAFAAAEEDTYSFTVNRVDEKTYVGAVTVFNSWATLTAKSSQNVYVLQLRPVSGNNYYVAATTGDKTIADLKGFDKFAKESLAAAIYVAIEKSAASAADAKAVKVGALLTFEKDPAANVKFTVTKEAVQAGITPVLVDGKNVGTWQNDNTTDHAGTNYSYTWKTDDQYLYFNAVYNGPLVSIVYSNGADGKKDPDANAYVYADGGTRIRLWFNDPQAAQTEWTHLVDVYYTGTGVYESAGEWTRYHNKLDTTGNFTYLCPTAVTTNLLNARNDVFTYEEKVTGANQWTVNLKIKLSAIGGADGDVQFIPTFSSAYTLKDGKTDSSTPDAKTGFNNLIGASYAYVSNNGWRSSAAVSTAPAVSATTGDKIPANIVENNVALNKNVLITLQDTNYKGVACLTDGVKYDGYHASNTYGAKNTERDIIIDLGQVYNDLTSVNVWFHYDNSPGVSDLPTVIKVAASKTGNAYTELGAADLDDPAYEGEKHDGGAACETIKFEKYVSARYIKVTVAGTAKGSTFCEIEVNNDKGVDTSCKHVSTTTSVDQYGFKVTTCDEVSCDYMVIKNNAGDVVSNLVANPYVNVAKDGTMVDSFILTTEGKNVLEITGVAEKTLQWDKAPANATNDQLNQLVINSDGTKNFVWANWAVYVIENVNGKYVVTDYVRHNVDTNGRWSKGFVNPMSTLKVPENGFLYFINVSKNPAAINNQLKGAEVEIVNLTASNNVLASGQGTIAFIENAYDLGLNIVTDKEIGVKDGTNTFVSNLTDGDYKLNATGFEGTALINNLNPYVVADRSFSLVYRFADKTKVEAINLGVNADTMKMVAFPELLNVYISDDGNTWTEVEYTDNMPTTVHDFNNKANCSKGTKTVTIDFKEDAVTTYVKVDFKMPKSPFTVENGYPVLPDDMEPDYTVAKPIYEFVAITEFELVYMQNVGYGTYNLNLGRDEVVNAYLTVDRTTDITFEGAGSDFLTSVTIGGTTYTPNAEGKFTAKLEAGSYDVTFVGHKYLATQGKLSVVPYIVGDAGHEIEIAEPTYVDATITAEHIDKTIADVNKDENNVPRIGMFYTYKMPAAGQFNLEVVPAESSDFWKVTVRSYNLDKDGKEVAVKPATSISNVGLAAKDVVKTISFLASKGEIVEINVLAVDKDGKAVAGDVQFVVWYNDDKPAAPVDPVEPTNKPADLNGDGEISAIEVAQVRLFALGKVAPTAEQLKIVDLDGNGKVDAVEAAQVRLHFLGKITLKGWEKAE